MIIKRNLKRKNRGMMDEMKMQTEMQIAQLRAMANNLDKDGKKYLLTLLDYQVIETNKFIEELRKDIEKNETKN